jgi:outer membrane protein assembly factor BamA
VRIASSTLLLLILTMSRLSLSAQQSAKETEPLDEGRLKGIARKLGNLASPDDKDQGISIEAGIIVAGSGLSGGVGYRRMNLFKSPIDVEVEGTVSVRLYQAYRASIGLLGERSSTLQFDTADSKVSSLFNASAPKTPGAAVFLEMRYRDYPRHTYYGTGMSSLEENRSDYALRGASVEGAWQWQVTPALGVGARGGWLGLDIGSGRDDSILNLEDRFIPATVSGLITHPAFFTYGAGIVHDTRSNPRIPEDGRMIGASLRRFSASEMEQHSFTRLTLDVRAYRRALSDRGVIATRGLLSTDLTGETGSTPFYLQHSLGGSATLRGFHSYRFADLALAHASVEYRWRAHRYVEVAPFFDIGTVAPGLSRLSVGALKMSPGVGIRARTDRRAIARLDWAWGSEGQRIVLDMGPAF